MGGAVKCEILPSTLYRPPQIKEFRNLVEFFKNANKSTRISSNFTFFHFFFNFKITITARIGEQTQLTFYVTVVRLNQ